MVKGILCIQNFSVLDYFIYLIVFKDNPEPTQRKLIAYLEIYQGIIKFDLKSYFFLLISARIFPVFRKVK